jgi:hypothetical protein
MRCCIFSSGSPFEIKTPEPKKRLPTQERLVRTSQPTERRIRALFPRTPALHT